MSIYFDNAATTMVCREAAEAALKCMTESYGNPSSTHTLGREAKKILAKSRHEIASSIHAKDSEIYFTSGGTESDNQAIRCGAFMQRHKGKQIISSPVEHDAVLKSLETLKKDGFEIDFVKPSPGGAVQPEAVKEIISQNTSVISLMGVNNETGAVTDIPSIAEVIKKQNPSTLLHVDAVQTFLKVPIDVNTYGADLISLSSHKIHGPKGIGALYIRDGLNLPPLLMGGGQENGIRSGTESLPAIAAFAAAVKAYRKDSESIGRMHSLRQYVAEKIKASFPDSIVIGGGAPHILCISFPVYRSEVILNYLDAKEICISKGSACKRGARSHVLTALNIPSKVIDGAVRISLSRFSTQEECDILIQALSEAKKFLIAVK